MNGSLLRHPKIMNKKKKPTNPRGVSTSEFWLCTGAALISVLWGAGIIDPNPDAAGTADRIGGWIVAGLSALGYGVSRGLAKMNRDPDA